jgi:hypothetical protein
MLSGIVYFMGWEMVTQQKHFCQMVFYIELVAVDTLLSVIGNSIHLVHCLKVKVCMFAH